MGHSVHQISFCHSVSVILVYKRWKLSYTILIGSSSSFYDLITKHFISFHFMHRNKLDVVIDWRKIKRGTPFTWKCINQLSYRFILETSYSFPSEKFRGIMQFVLSEFMWCTHTHRPTHRLTHMHGDEHGISMKPNAPLSFSILQFDIVYIFSVALKPLHRKIGKSIWCNYHSDQYNGINLMLKPMNEFSFDEQFRIGKFTVFHFAIHDMHEWGKRFPI